MKTDLYTRIILTVIAAALIINLFKGSITTPAQAAIAGNKRVIELPVNADGTVDVNIKSINGDFSAFQFSTPIPVVIKSK